MTKVVFLDAATLPQGLAFDPSSGIRYTPHETAAPDDVAPGYRCRPLASRTGRSRRT